MDTSTQPMLKAMIAKLTKVADSGAKNLKNARAIFRSDLGLIRTSEIPSDHDQMRVAVLRVAKTLTLNPEANSDVVSTIAHIEAERKKSLPTSKVA